MPRHKRRLNDLEVVTAESLIRRGFSLGQLARHFGVNKPSIKKSLPDYFRKEVITLVPNDETTENTEENTQVDNSGNDQGSNEATNGDTGASQETDQNPEAAQDQQPQDESDSEEQA